MNTFNIIKNEFDAEYIRIGEQGRGRSYAKVFVHNHEGYTDENGNLNLPDVFRAAYWFSKSGLLHLDFSKSSRTIAYLDSYGGYSRRRNGYIYATQPNAIIALGNGADGDAGRIGQWDIALVDVTDCIAVARTSGHYDDDCRFIINGKASTQSVSDLFDWDAEHELVRYRNGEPETRR